MNPVAIAAIVIGSAFTYIVIGGVVWHILKARDWDEVAAGIAPFFWPTIPFVLAAMWLSKLLAIRVPAWIVQRAERKRTTLPRAEVRRG